MSPEKKPAGPSLANLLVELNQGRFHEEATEAQQKLVKEMTRVAASGRSKVKGTLTLKLNFTLDRGRFDVDPDVTTKAPAVLRAVQTLYAGPDGQLLKEDPAQYKLGVEVRDPGFGQVKDFGKAAANDKE